MGYVSKHGVEALQRYKYSGIDRSYMAKWVFQPFWRFAVNFFPMWMPPNMITLMGFGMILTSALLSYVYSPHLDAPLPRWVHFAHGILLFLYQTFDAVDGKQARRTNSSSPLGELFDHGCDALTCSFENMAFASSVMAGKLSFWFWVIATIPFYGATWESFFTDTLILPEINGPTEGLMIIYCAHIFTGIVGPAWWTQSIKNAVPFLGMIPFIPDVSVTVVVIFLMMSVAVAPTVGYNFVNVYKVVRGRGTSFRTALAMLLPFWTLLGAVLFWGWVSPSDILRFQPHLVMMGAGFAFAYLVGRLILAHLCDEPKGLKTGMCTALLYLPFAIGNALSANYFNGEPLVDETWVLVGFCAFTASLYGHFVVSVIHEITEALGIRCFRIGKVKDGKGT
jgi:ethanolaminephosphotransferase